MTAESVYYWKKQNDTNIVVIQPLGRREKLCRICFGVVRTLLIMLGTALLTAILTFLHMCALGGMLYRCDGGLKKEKCS